MATLVTPPFGESLGGCSVFVTGAYGLIGSRLCADLLERGARVTVLRRSTTLDSALVLDGTEADCEVVDGSLDDEDALLAALTAHRCEAVFHLAAQPLVGTAAGSAGATFEANVKGTWGVMEACHRASVGRVVVASSDNAYGPSARLPHTEDTPLRASHPYDASKAAADLIARSYWTSRGIPVAAMRLSNVYGGGDRNLSRLVPGTIAALLAGRAPVVQSDGAPRRDFLHVDDAANAYLAVADLLASGHGCGEPFNAGRGEPHAVLDVVNRLCAIDGATITPTVLGGDRLPGELFEHWSDASKLRESTGWQPQVALDDGLTRTFDWYREHVG